MNTFVSPGGDAVEKTSLNNLARVVLNPRHRAMLDAAMKDCGGDAATRNRKLFEARDLLSLGQLAPPGRLRIDSLEMTEHLRALISLEVPVACRPNANNELQLRNRALLGFTYRTEAFQRPLPGSAFFQVILPRDVWLPQIHQPEQSLCIAPQIPAGSRTAMLILRAYGALSMQSIQVDVQDPAGVFAPEIAQWWQHNLHRVPLTNVALLEPNKPAKPSQTKPGQTDPNKTDPRKTQEKD
jgi:hypothetical protein